jgi:amino acid transporter
MNSTTTPEPPSAPITEVPATQAPSTDSSMPPPAPRRGLRRDCVSLLESFAQTLGVLSPAGTISVIIPLLIVSAANGTWLLLLVTLGVFLMVMSSVIRFASLHASAGSLAAFSELGWGPRGGLIGGWVYVLGMSYCVPSAALTSAAYCDVLLTAFIGPGTPARVAALTVIITGACWMASYRGIKLSTNLMLVIECASVSLMFVLILAGMVHAHAWVDHAQLELKNVTLPGFQGGLVLAFMLMAGFEGTTSLGEEAQDAKRTIPRAIFGSMIPLALLYLLMTYCMVALGNVGMIRGTANGLTVPFDDIAHGIGHAWLGPVSSLGVALSYFGCALGSLTIASRVLFAMAREGEFWRPFGEAHPRNATPHRAIALICLVGMAISSVMLLTGVSLGTSINFISQLGSVGLILAYLIVVLALPRYLRREGLLRGSDRAVATVASALLLLVLLFSVYPVPDAPYVYVVYIFAGSTLAGIAISLALAAGGSRGGGLNRYGNRYAPSSVACRPPP